MHWANHVNCDAYSYVKVSKQSIFLGEKKQLQVFNIIILHQSGVVCSALAIFGGIYNCKSYLYLF